MKKVIDLEGSIYDTALKKVVVPGDDDQWYQDYDQQQPCDFCGNTIYLEDETAWTDCQKCDKRMCGDCRDKVYESCHVCQENIIQNNGDQELEHNKDDGDSVCMIICCCEGCMGYCRKCNLVFHHGGACQVEHEKMCTDRGRAQRKLGLVQNSIQRKERYLQDIKCVQQVVKRKVEELEHDILVAQKQKIRMEKKLRTL